MSEKPYHKYVFDKEKRVFVGRFEEMYQNEDRKGYDSWNQESSDYFEKKILLSILGKYNFPFILDLGCEKGASTHLFKKTDNYVTGVDISKTAINKAKKNIKE